MKISSKVAKAFNNQINAELHASYIYLAISGYFESLSLRGFAQWMRTQAQEEIEHAMKFYNHLVERDARVELGAIDKPPRDWKSVLDAAKAAYTHEQKVTKMIHDLAVLTDKEQDFAANNLVQWFVDEQVEEEQQTREMVKNIEYVGKSNSGLLMLDKKYGKRKEDD